MPRSAAALEDNARRILERLGCDEPPVDRVWGFNSDNPTLREYVRRTDSSPGRWEVLRHPRQFDVMFFYRQAPLHLKPLAWNGFVDLWDPPPNPGDVQMGTDLHGRLFWLQVLPAEASPPGGDANSPWPQLFDVAGLDMGHFTPVPPSRHPPVSADARAAWSGTLEDFGPYPVRVEAAALRGRPVYFELVVPWDRYWDVSNSQPSPTGPAFGSVWRFYWVGVGSFVLFAFLASSVLVVRNWLSGRGDRHGALRAGAVVFCVRLGMWLVGGHHVPSLAPELELFVTALGKSLTDAAATWCLYIALEPYARRLHPRLLVSWTRILHVAVGFLVLPSRPGNQRRLQFWLEAEDGDFLAARFRDLKRPAAAPKIENLFGRCGAIVEQADAAALTEERVVITEATSERAVTIRFDLPARNDALEGRALGHVKHPSL
jgi:hypothetical protein